MRRRAKLSPARSAAPPAAERSVGVDTAEQVVLLQRTREGLAATGVAAAELAGQSREVRAELARLEGLAQSVAAAGLADEARAILARAEQLAAALAALDERAAVVAATAAKLRVAERRLAALVATTAPVADTPATESTPAGVDAVPAGRSLLYSGGAVATPRASATAVLTEERGAAPEASPSPAASPAVGASEHGHGGAPRPARPLRPGSRLALGAALGVLALGLALLAFALWAPPRRGDLGGAAPATAAGVLAQAPERTGVAGPAVASRSAAAQAGAPATASPAALAPDEAEARRRVVAAEAGLRSGQFAATIDYGNGQRSSVTVRFDYGDGQRPARLQLATTARGAIGDQLVERIVIGDRAWQRQPDGRWSPAASRDGVAEHLQDYLPGLAAIANPALVEEAGATILRWYDPARDADSELQVDAATGTPRALRQVSRAGGVTLTVVYPGWNTPQDIAPPAP